LAGEVKGGRRTFLLGLGIAFPLVLMTYILPTVFALAAAPDMFSNTTLWVAGGFSKIARRQVPWLGLMMDVAGALSNFGQYCACVAAVARVAWFASCDGLSKTLPSIVGWSHRDDAALTPVAAIVLTSAAILGLTAISFDVMVQMFLFAHVCNLMCLFAAFVFLRFRSPDAPRPFVAPGNRYVAVFYGVPTAAIGIGSLVFTDGWVWIVNGCLVLGIVLLYLAKMWWVRTPMAQQAEIARRYRNIK
jgi:amino acid transporter